MRGPYDYHYPTVDELRPYLGDSWGICRNTPANRERYGNMAQFEIAIADAAFSMTRWNSLFSVVRSDPATRQQMRYWLKRADQALSDAVGFASR